MKYWYKAEPGELESTRTGEGGAGSRTGAGGDGSVRATAALAIRSLGRA